jgi:hypothetical protein
MHTPAHTPRLPVEINAGFELDHHLIGDEHTTWLWPCRQWIGQHTAGHGQDQRQNDYD